MKYQKVHIRCKDTGKLTEDYALRVVSDDQPDEVTIDSEEATSIGSTVRGWNLMPEAWD